jgi:hypothetical protein
MRSARRLRGGERKSTRTVLIFANVKLYNTVMLSTATVLSRRVTFALIDLDEPLTGAPATIHGAVTALVPWHDYMRSPRVGLSRHNLSYHFPIAVLRTQHFAINGYRSRSRDQGTSCTMHSTSYGQLWVTTCAKPSQGSFVLPCSQVKAQPASQPPRIRFGSPAACIDTPVVVRKQLVRSARGDLGAELTPRLPRSPIEGIHNHLGCTTVRL